MKRRVVGHALLLPDDPEPYRCRCGKEYDWPLSENNAGGITRSNARDLHRFHVADVQLAYAILDIGIEGAEHLAQKARSTP